MRQDIFAPRSVAAVAEAYVAARVGTKHPVSTGDAVRAIRQAVPICEHTDRELVDVITVVAVSSGCNVAFDTSTGKPGELFQVPEILHR